MFLLQQRSEMGESERPHAVATGLQQARLFPFLVAADLPRRRAAGSVLSLLLPSVMGFFDRSEDPGERAVAGGEDAQTLARIRRGGVPLAAESRLRALAMDGAMFTSGLSVSEFALLDAAQIRPLAQVLGASVVQVGPQLLPPLPARIVREEWKKTYEEPRAWQRLRFGWETPVVCELGRLAHAWTLARQRAFGRLRAEALAVNADLVTGVRLARASLDLGAGTIDLVVSGTAARGPRPSEQDPPILTDLSAQDFWRLYSAGCTPTGLVSETAVVFASAARRTQWERSRSPQQNREHEELTRGFYLASERVRARLLAAVEHSGGEGVVGVELSREVHEGEFEHRASAPQRKSTGWHRGAMGLPYYFSGAGESSRSGWIITMHAAGTAVRRDTNDPQQHPKPETALRI